MVTNAESIVLQSAQSITSPYILRMQTIPGRESTKESKKKEQDIFQVIADYIEQV